MSNARRIADLAAVTATVDELNLTDGSTAGTVVNSRAVVYGPAGEIAINELVLDSDSTVSGDLDVSGSIKATSYEETFKQIGSSSNSTIVNCEDGNAFAHTLTQNTTFTFANPPSSGTSFGFSLNVTQDGSASGYSLTWPSSVDWVEATPPTLSATPNAVDVFVFFTYNGGTTWYGFTAGQSLA